MLVGAGVSKEQSEDLEIFAAAAVAFTERGAGLLRIEVQDTGIGIALEDPARIFEPFVEAGERTTPKGTGLGLTVIRQFVELMGGTIGVESASGERPCFAWKCRWNRRWKQRN